jgi:hypothetical protein
MEETANFYYIDHIICCYILMVAMAPLNLNEKESPVLSLQVSQILDLLKVKRLQQLHRESYLGPMQFEDDLRHSCAEFYKELKKEMGIYTSEIVSHELIC